MTISIARIIIASALVSIAAAAGGCGAKVSVCASDVGGFGGSGGEGGERAASSTSSSSSGSSLCLTHEDCTDDDPCTQDACNVGNGQCLNVLVPDCDPAFCLLDVCCKAGQCIDPASGQCVDVCPTGTTCVKLVCK